ncbi:MAG: ergothioneine biosynthesis protein EgtB [Gammaproteobacteria bacterium]|nr:ergothioneine biosynthesis protein EgtB [Gammaproteobacteria bacterium]NNM11895.1 ergothioneine biosynthesis protein EgtB [Pseudomonadales bacterium]
MPSTVERRHSSPGSCAATSEAGAASLGRRYAAVRALSEQYCKPLEKEDFIPQVEEYASPPLWHLAHTSWFFEEMLLKPHLPQYQVFHPQFSYLFNSYYESIGERQARHRRGAITRPGVETVFAYRHAVDDAMQRLLDSGVAQDKQVAYLVELGLQHEQQHQELLLTDLKLAFYYNPMLPVYDQVYNEESLQGKSRQALAGRVNEAMAVTASGNVAGNILVAEGLYDIGFAGEGFCFDNEIAKHKVFLPGCELASQLVLNREYLEFIDDGAYQDHSLWLSEGWDWVQATNASAPLYWQQHNGQWKHFTLAGLALLDPALPVNHVNYFEASAFAAWRGMRLPTEFEWEAASGRLDWGQRWEWTQSAYAPYPGFKVSSGAAGEYNGKFMVNQMVLRGASITTSPGHSRPSYRNFFHPHLQWQSSGIRLAK